MILATCFPSDSFWYVILLLVLVWVVHVLLNAFTGRRKDGEDE